MRSVDNFIFKEIYGEYIEEPSVHMAPFVSILCQKKITIKSDVYIGPSVTIVDFDHDYKNFMHNIGEKEEVYIGNDTWIGANAVILKGVHLGIRCVVGAGSVVVGDNYPDGSVIVGNPGKIIKNHLHE
jgi:acetyltransferase-like isoleucine patch superfamily enzyme